MLSGDAAQRKGERVVRIERVLSPHAGLFEDFTLHSVHRIEVYFVKGTLCKSLAPSIHVYESYF